MNLPTCQDSFFASLLTSLYFNPGSLWSSWTNLVALSYHSLLLLLFLIQSIPWASSTGELLLIWQHCPQRCLHWLPLPFSNGWGICPVHCIPRTLTHFLSLISTGLPSTLHRSAFWAKPVPSLFSRTYWGVKEKDYLTTNDDSFYRNRTIICLFLYTCILCDNLLSYIAPHFLELSCKNPTE